MEAGDRIEYAHALLLIAKLGSAPRRLAMAATHGILSERIFHILGLPSAKPRIAGLAASLFFFMASLAAGNALLVLAAPLPALHARENMAAIASLAGDSARPQLESLPVGDAQPAATARLSNNDYVIPRRVARIRPLPISSISAPILIASVDLPPTLPSDNQSVIASIAAQMEPLLFACPCHLGRRGETRCDGPVR